MFPKLLVSLAIMAMLSKGISGISYDKIKDNLNEKMDYVRLSMLDDALMDYYAGHGYTLPSSLSASVMSEMGLGNMDLSKVNYSRVSDNKFVLSMTPGVSERSVNSLHSGKNLPYGGVNSEFDALNSGTMDTVEDDVDVTAKDVFIGNDVMIHGSVKVGNGTYNDGSHTFTHNYTIGTDANVNSDQVNIADNTAIGDNANIRNFVEIIGTNINIGDRVTLWSEAAVGDNCNILNSDAGEMVFQTIIPSGTTVKKTGSGSGNLTFYSGSTIKGGINEIYNESIGNIDIYTVFPKDTVLRRLGIGKGNLTYFINSSILGSHTFRNDGDTDIDILCTIDKNTDFTRGGTGLGKLTLNEDAVLSGNSSINIYNGGAVSLSSVLNGNNINYIGAGNGALNLSTASLFNGSCSFLNDSNGTINFNGEMMDGSMLKRTGSGTGTITFGANTVIEGTSEFYNESVNGMSIYVPKVIDGVKISNKGARGSLSFGIGTYFAPGADFTVENISGTSVGFSSWDSSFQVNSGKITVSGTGSGSLVMVNKFGGNLNVVIDSGNYIYFGVAKTDWDGETIRYKMNRGNTGADKRVNIGTTRIGKYLDVETVPSVNLYGTFADNTKIRITGNSDFGSISLSGNYSGTVNMEMTGTTGSGITSYNDLSDNSKIIFNADNDGDLYFYAGSVVDGTLTVNNHSKYCVYFRPGSVIHDGVVINLSETCSNHVYIDGDIPAGSVLNY